VKIVFSGMVAGDPGQGGATWAVLQYVLGLRALGHDVVLVEPVPALDPGVVAQFEAVVDRYDLAGALLVEGTRATAGLPYDALTGGADLLVNVSGMLADDGILGSVAVRAYLDLDPAFNQLWDADGIDMGFDRHDRFVTVGLALGDPSCPIPTGGRHWVRTPQPVVLDHWPVAERIERDALTTIANWRGYGSVELDGVHLGQKAHSLRPLFDLPERSGARFVLALAIHPDERPDLEALDRHGWELVDPVEVAGTPQAYAAFVRGSKAEFGLAKSGYVLSRCGWFSDRSVCYLASGRPVIAQETGFSAHLPAGEGLLPFTTADDVVAAIEAIDADYARHTRAARALAEDVFDAAKVLPRLLEALA
jgi:hypothetical protein